MRKSHARWYGVITLFIIVMISYVDRINISVLITDREFLQHIGLAPEDRTHQGILATAFMLGYGFSSLVLTPFCSALFGVRRSLLFGLTFWGCITFLSPYMQSYELLLFSRLILGISEGPLLALAGSYIKAHFDGHANGKPNAFIGMGAGLGLAIGYPFIGFLLLTQSWQFSFYTLGIINIALGIPLVLAFIHMPTTYSKLLFKPHSLGEARKQLKELFSGALQTRHLWLMTVISSAFLSYIWGASNWLPAYLKEARGFSIQEMSWLASLPQYAIVIAVLLGSVLHDRLPRRHVPLIFVGASMAVALCIFLAINTTHRFIAAYCLIAANFFWGAQSVAIPSTVQFYSRPEHTASAYGVVNGISALVSGLMPALMGWVIALLTTATEGATAGFFFGFSLLIGTQLIVLVGGLILWWQERSALYSQQLPQQ